MYEQTTDQAMPAMLEQSTDQSMPSMHEQTTDQAMRAMYDQAPNEERPTMHENTPTTAEPPQAKFKLDPTYNYQIPSLVLNFDSQQLSAGAKLLYAVIASLARKRGYCNATNSYLSQTYGFNTRTISRYLKQLKTCGLVRVQYAPMNRCYRKILVTDIKQMTQHPEKLVEQQAAELLKKFKIR